MGPTEFSVKVADVHKDNINILWPCLIHSIKNSSFVAIDCELSGLGNKKLINAQAVDERFKNISEVAKTRSIISIGLSCFRSDDLQQKICECSQLQFNVQTFNIMALCDEEYVVEPSALQFLVNHDFDFQKQYSKGVSYSRGSLFNKKNATTGKKSSPTSWDLRNLFEELVIAKVPIILHNGLVDLVFMYHNLYAEIPSSLSTFLADLDMMFPLGIYDTKYIAEFQQRMKASFLEYVFRTNQISNLAAKQKNQNGIDCHHSLPNLESVSSWDCAPRLHRTTNSIEICADYTNFGHCKNGTTCLRSHDVVRAVLEEKQSKPKKRKKGHQQLDENNLLDLEFPNDSCYHQDNHFKGHRAGHDAFMTAYSFASFLFGKIYFTKLNSDGVYWHDLTLEERNRVSLSGKDFPLLIQKSNFAKYSKDHLAKYAQLTTNAETSS